MDEVEKNITRFEIICGAFVFTSDFNIRLF